MKKTIGLIKIFSKHSGGNAYKQAVIKALAPAFDAQLLNFEGTHFKNVYLKGIESFWKLFMLKGEKDVWIKDFYATLLMQKKRTKGKHVSLIFHLDFSGFPPLLAIPFAIFEKIFFYRQLKKADAIVTIAEYWQNFFLEKGYHNVHKIYCGFDLAEFEFSDQELEAFKQKYNLLGKPVVYIGNCQKAKGVLDSYDALKALDAILVTSGRKEVDIPVLNINGARREYLMLLKVSSVAVAMSQFKEGWCITAHEAMLCKTPVIGSGVGGMKELLGKGGQIISTKEALTGYVTYLLQNKEAASAMAEQGHQFAKQFTSKKFESEWVALIRLLESKNV